MRTLNEVKIVRWAPLQWISAKSVENHAKTINLILLVFVCVFASIYELKIVVCSVEIVYARLCFMMKFLFYFFFYLCYSARASFVSSSSIKYICHNVIPFNFLLVNSFTINCFVTSSSSRKMNEINMFSNKILRSDLNWCRHVRKNSKFLDLVFKEGKYLQVLLHANRLYFSSMTSHMRKNL